MAADPAPFKPWAATLFPRVKPRAEVAELEDALDSKSSGAWPRAGSIPAFGIRLTLLDPPGIRDGEDDNTASKLGRLA